MKVIKKGDKRFVRVCDVDIYEGKCYECGAIFEIQYGEMGREECGGYHTISCPYCHKFHSNYGFRKVRRQTMLFENVKDYDCLHSPTRFITESEYKETISEK